MIKNIRKEMGYSQTKMAKLLDISCRRYWQKENTGTFTDKEIEKVIKAHDDNILKEINLLKNKLLGTIK